MKKIGCFTMIVIVILLIILSPSCGTKTLTYLDENNKTRQIEVDHYGLFNPSEKMAGVKYQVSIRNIVWGCILSETIFMPVILFGWNVYKPVAVTNPSLLPK